MVFMNLTESHGSANAGHFRPLKLLTRPGSVFDPSPHAAFATYYEVEVRLYDLIWRCLAPHLGGRLPAGNFASICGTFIGGPHPDTGRHFTIVEPQVGGWGASPASDGNTAIFSGFHGDTFNCPAEVAEARYGLYVDRCALNDAPGGEGEHRGGKGIVLEYRVRSNGCFFTCAYTRNIHKPVGAGGRARGLAQLRGGDPRATARSSSSRSSPAWPSNEGDVIRIHTGSGGGYGDPSRRARELVLDDLRNGFLTAERGDRGLRPRAAGVVSSTADPFTLEIIQGSLQAASDEMFAVLRKTAMSAIIYEVLDAGTAITDGHGNLASSGAGIPSFVGVLDKAVKRILELHDAEGAIRPGDVFVTNDPFYGGVTHLNDVVIAMPVFAGGQSVRVGREHRPLERRRRDGARLDLDAKRRRSSRRACGCPR